MSRDTSSIPNRNPKNRQRWIEHYTEIKDPETISRILRHGQNPDWVPVLGGQRGNLGQTLLHWAVFYAAKESVSILVAAGADIHKKDLKGKTPLELAIQQKACPEIIELVSEKRSIVTKYTVIPE